MPIAVFAMTSASLSSVLASPAKSLEAPCIARPGQVGALEHPGHRWLGRARATPMLRDLVDHNEGVARYPGRRARRGRRSLFATGALSSDLAIGESRRRPSGTDFPTSSPMHGPPACEVAATVVSSKSVGRSEPPPRDTHITWPWRLRPAVSYQSSGTATASGGNTPRALYGAGAEGHPEATDRRPLGAASTLRQPADSGIPTGMPQKTVMGMRKEEIIRG